MTDSLLIAIFSGLGAMVGWGVADFMAKEAIDKIGDLRTLFWAQAIGILPLVALFLVNPDVPKLNHYDPIFLILFGIFSAVSYLPLYAGFGKGEVSLLSPIFASFSVIVVILSFIFLDAHLTSPQWLAVLLVFIGILLLSSDPREIRQYLKVKSTRVKGVPEVLAATLMYSVWLVFLDKFLSGKAWVFYLLIIRCVSAFTLLVYSRSRKKGLNVTNKSLWKFLAVVGVFDVAAFAAVSYGYSHSSYIGVVTVLSATFSLPTMILAYIFLKERATSLQAIASALIIFGIIVISLV